MLPEILPAVAVAGRLDHEENGTSRGLGAGRKSSRASRSFGIATAAPIFNEAPDILAERRPSAQGMRTMRGSCERKRWCNRVRLQQVLRPVGIAGLTAPSVVTNDQLLRAPCPAVRGRAQQVRMVKSVNRLTLRFPSLDSSGLAER